jgi:hypothetical protein
LALTVERDLRERPTAQRLPALWLNKHEVYPDRLMSVSMNCPQTSVSATGLTLPPRGSLAVSRTGVRNQRRATSAVLGCETVSCQPDVVANDRSAWPRSLQLAQRDLGSMIGMMAGRERSPDVPDPAHRLLRWSFSWSFHQALLQPTRPHSTECPPNLSCLDRTGAV